MALSFWSVTAVTLTCPLEDRWEEMIEQQGCVLTHTHTSDPEDARTSALLWSHLLSQQESDIGQCALGCTFIETHHHTGHLLFSNQQRKLYWSQFTPGKPQVVIHGGNKPSVRNNAPQRGVEGWNHTNSLNIKNGIYSVSNSSKARLEPAASISIQGSSYENTAYSFFTRQEWRVLPGPWRWTAVQCRAVQDYLH